MRYDVSQKVDRQSALKEALSKWDKAQADAIAPVETEEGVNVVGKFTETDTGQERYLRLVHKTHRTQEQVAAELEYVTYLKQKGCAVAAPVCSKAGNFIEVIEAGDAGRFYASVFEAAVGVRDNWGADEKNRKILFEQGRAIGKMHAAAREFVPAGPKRFGWGDDGFAKFIGPHLPASQEKVKKELEVVMAWVEKHPVTRENWGLIHGDFGTINYRRHGDKLTAFDFDDCCYHWYAFDVAIAMRPASQLEAKYRRAYLKCMMDGYAKECPLSFTCREVSWLSRLSNLFRYLHLIRNWDLVNLTPEQDKELETRYKAAAEPVDWC